MTSDDKNPEAKDRSSNGKAPEGSADASGAQPASPRQLVPLPGLVAIALYLLLLAGTIIVGVVDGGRYPLFFLVFSALFISACAGLLLLFRWAWALALGAVALLTAYDFWIFTSRSQASALVQGLLNLIFFFYLIRTDVRRKLR
jgi:hypothetical protein